MSRVGMVVIGDGKWGNVISKNVKNHKDYLFLGTATRSNERLIELLSNPSVESTWIAVNPSNIPEVLKTCVAYKKHIICEKPILKIPYSAYAHKNNLMVNYTHLFNATFQDFAVHLNQFVRQIDIKTSGDVIRSDCSVIQDYGSHGFSIMEYLLNSLDDKVIQSSFKKYTFGANIQTYTARTINGRTVSYTHRMSSNKDVSVRAMTDSYKNQSWEWHDNRKFNSIANLLTIFAQSINNKTALNNLFFCQNVESNIKYVSSL